VRCVTIAVVALAAGSVACTGSTRETQTSPDTRSVSERSTLRLQAVVGGLDSPVHVSAPPGEPDHLYIVEQAGRIRVLERGQLRTFLDIRPLVRGGGEQGLFAIAFHPRYEQNHRFYVNYTDDAGDTRVVEYRSNGETALTASRRQLLFVDQPYENHNGGQVAFGPNGRLYVGMGDGGAADDPQNRAQDPGSLLGKMLTIDVDQGGALPEIDAIGLRNPWRFSFDRANGDLYIGDVGQDAWEEIDYLPRAQLPSLQNYGWDVYEGRAQFEEKRPSGGDLVMPIAVYGRAVGCSVTGGFVYRGTAVLAARGRYFYGDYCSGIVWSLTVTRGRASDPRREPFTVAGLTSFGEDARGELYLVSHGGSIYRLGSAAG
jgi:glucose/arabinose dehydrogenase